MPFVHAISLAALALAAEQPAPLPAYGKWTVNFAEKICVAERKFGLVDRPTIFTIRPAPLGQKIEFRLSQVDPAYVSRTDPGKITLLPSGRTFSIKLTTFGPVTGGLRVTSFSLEDVEVKDVVTASTIVIDRGHAGPSVSLVPDSGEALATTMTRCGDRLLSAWGLDPVAMHKLSRQPKPVGGSEKAWFKPGDYPKVARGNFRMGRSLALVTIDGQGVVATCSVADSAGNPDLDSKTCAILKERGRYEPGLDAEGKPVSSQKLVGVAWVLWPFAPR